MVRFSQQNHFDSLGSFDFFGFFCLIDKIIQFIYNVHFFILTESAILTIVSVANYGRIIRVI